MKNTLDAKTLKTLTAPLARVDKTFALTHPGESGDRQPVHVVYGGAHLFKRDSAPRLGSLAQKALQEYAPNARDFRKALDLPEDMDVETVYDRILEKLRREPVEDFRIDFEDGYGNRPDSEEDGHAASAAVEVAEGLKAGTLPPFLGIRIKPFSEALRNRSLRTLDIFVTTLAQAKAGWPSYFVVTLPKITDPAQVEAAAKALELLEAKLKIPKKTLKLELMIETPQSIIDIDGGAAPPRLVAAGRGRVVSAHFGTYDYTALCGITSSFQSMVHPSCDFAKHVMQVSLAQTGILLSDGATNVMPVPIHRGDKLSPSQIDENRDAVHRAWRLHFSHVQHSLETGYYEGWDLHPAQLVTRYAAVFSFFAQGLKSASARLSNFIEKAAQATLVGDVFDDAATGQGLLNFFLRGLNCGAISMEEARATGLAKEELLTRSFLKIIEGRKQGSPKKLEVFA